jgi:hypothetical protein
VSLVSRFQSYHLHCRLVSEVVQHSVGWMGEHVGPRGSKQMLKLQSVVKVASGHVADKSFYILPPSTQATLSC